MPNKQKQPSDTYTNVELVSIFEQINEKIFLLDSYTTKDFLPISKLIRQYNTQIQEILKSNTSDLSTAVANHCKDNTQTVVTCLQVHDIIKQKLEHIHIIHQGVITELQELRNNNNMTDTHYVSVMQEIILMNKGQLLMIEEEYNMAIATIMENMKDTEDRLKEISNDEIDFPIVFASRELFEKEMEMINDSLLKLASQVNPFHNDEAQIEERMNNISSIFTMDSEREVLNKIVHGKENAQPESTGEKNKSEDQTEFF
jgi:anion-transporting  ArsA/GET3 family ATPase